MQERKTKNIALDRQTVIKGTNGSSLIGGNVQKEMCRNISLLLST
jgi:hypothetical protein